MNKVALIIIYNHRYDKNIDVVEKLYGSRFKHIYHLMPFYDGNRENVIPVYENSRYFQGYIAQGLKSFFSKSYSHYIFVADDLILNPEINEKNYKKRLKLKRDSSFLPNFISLHEAKRWARVGNAYRYCAKVKGLEIEGQFPTYDEAYKRFADFGLQIKALKYQQISRFPDIISKRVPIGSSLFRTLLLYLSHLISKINPKKYHLSYPLVGSYSDFFVVSSCSIRKFSHYCGVFAATNLFVEVAIPTALVLTSKNIVTENDIKFRGKALWTKEDYKILDKFDNKLENLLENFPKEKLYLHPIKLSKWETKL